MFLESVIVAPNSSEHLSDSRQLWQKFNDRTEITEKWQALKQNLLENLQPKQKISL
jgi:hypothetical protein